MEKNVSYEILEKLVNLDFNTRVARVKPAVFATTWEKSFLFDLGQRWVNGHVYPQSWTSKQKETIKKIYEKQDQPKQTILRKNSKNIIGPGCGQGNKPNTTN